MWNEIVEENRNWRVSGRALFGPDRSDDAPGRLAGDECRIFGMHSRMREVRKKETIYSQGDADSSIYMLYDGAVNLTRITPRGDRLITDIVGRGTMFGGTADGTIHRRNESAIVLDDGLLCAVSSEGFSRIAETAPELAMKMKGLLEERRCRREDRLVNLLFCTVEKRFARTLLDLIGDFGSLHDGGYLLNITLTHQTYADLVASSRETITMVLGRLRRAGVIDYEDRNIIIQSVDKLNRIAR
jgi:CRP/FNR family cyclic AMP-dependent transcriptional regulator